MKTYIDKNVSKKADEFAEREYMCGAEERDRISFGFYHGYKEAEKDCALTWEDVQAIFRIADNYDSELNRPKYLTQEYCEEVLHRFNQIKEEKK